MFSYIFASTPEQSLKMYTLSQLSIDTSSGQNFFLARVQELLCDWSALSKWAWQAQRSEKASSGAQNSYRSARPNLSI